MKIPFFVIAFFASAALCAQPVFPLRGNSYVQRGILKYGGEEFPITVFVKYFGLSSETAIVVDSSMGNLAKFVLGSDGSEKSLEVSQVIPERIVRKTMLRDARAVFGYNGLLGADVVKMSKNLRGFAADLKFDGYSVKFSDYKLWGEGKLLPQTIEIASDSYKLKLTLVALLK